MKKLITVLLIIAIVFFILANKPSQGFVLQTNCAEFYVFIVATIVSVILLGVGVFLTIIGVNTKHHYSQLLKDINNKTFDIDLHNSRYTYGMALELIEDLQVMKVLANYTLELFKDANKPCGKFTKCNNAEGCDNCAEFDTWLKESEGKK